MSLNLPTQPGPRPPGFTPKPAKGSGRSESKARNPAPEKAKPERKGVSPRLRAMVMERDGFKCQRCGVRGGGVVDGGVVETLHVDHIIPVAQGGTSGEENLQTLCSRCNLGKGARREPKERIDGNKIVSQLKAIVGKKRSGNG